MKHIAFVAMIVLCVASLSMAADFPKVEIFGGYSLWRSADNSLDDASTLEGSIFEIPDFGDATISNIKTSKLLKKGINASFTYNAASKFGIEAAFRYNTDQVINFDLDAGEFGTASVALKVKDLAFGVGPKFTFRNSSPVTPFAHILIGLDKMKFSALASAEGQSDEADIMSDTGLGVTLGGGIDIKVSKKIAIRLIQADYYMTRHFEDTQKYIALSFGVVFGFGK
jgi:opacity protein-like surface antigen